MTKGRRACVRRLLVVGGAGLCAALVAGGVGAQSKPKTQPEASAAPPATDFAKAPTLDTAALERKLATLLAHDEEIAQRISAMEEEMRIIKMRVRDTPTQLELP